MGCKGRMLMDAEAEYCSLRCVQLRAGWLHSVRACVVASFLYNNCYGTSFAHAGVR